MVRLVTEHWELSRRTMELFIAPKNLTSETMRQLGSDQAPRKPRRAKAGGA